MTVKLTVVVWVRLPLVPRIVIVYVRLVVVLRVATVIVEDPEPLMDAGLNVTVAPLGAPLWLRLTAPENPFSPVTVTV